MIKAPDTPNTRRLFLPLKTASWSCRRRVLESARTLVDSADPPTPAILHRHIIQALLQRHHRPCTLADPPGAFSTLHICRRVLSTRADPQAGTFSPSPSAELSRVYPNVLFRRLCSEPDAPGVGHFLPRSCSTPLKLQRVTRPASKVVPAHLQSRNGGLPPYAHASPAGGGRSVVTVLAPGQPQRRLANILRLSRGTPVRDMYLVPESGDVPLHGAPTETNTVSKVKSGPTSLPNQSPKPLNAR